jgi:cytoskeletal protein CcmA (bactofilin family)
MKKTRIFAFLFALLLVLPLGVSAYSIKTENSVYVAKDEVVEGNLYAAGSSINIDGAVRGDVICAGQSVIINGTVDGDVICAGQSIIVSGAVGGSLRIAGNSLNLSGTVERSAMLFGGFINTGGDAKVNWDAMIAAGNADIRGKFGRDLHGAAGQALIGADIAKNVDLEIGESIRPETRGIGMDIRDQEPLKITKDAKIGGNLTYTSNIAANIEEGASIQGETKQNTPQPVGKRTGQATGGWFIISLFAAMVVGLVLISLWGEPLKKITDLALEKFGPAIGWGAVILFLGPIIVVLLLITLIGMPLALILFGLWLIAVYVSKIIIAILVGRSIISRVRNKQKESMILSMILGVILVWILCAFPYIGWLLTLFVVLWGLGGLWLYFRRA